VVQIAPQKNPSNCLTVKLKDINIQQIVANTMFPPML
jgi:hypothetical protein